MRQIFWLVILVLGLSGSGAWASSAPKPAESSGDEAENATFTNYPLQPPKIIADPIPGFKVVMSLAIFPGVPERAACRFTVRSVNDSKVTLSTQYLVRTYNTEENILHVWMIPSGELKPGTSSERIYSCKRAKGMILDQDNASAWPRYCVVNGEDMSPCPVTMNLSTNIKQLDPAKLAKPATPAGKGGH